MCVCVWEDFWEGRREEEEKEGADTALKTKTPHVNVGKTNMMLLWALKCGTHVFTMVYKTVVCFRCYVVLCAITVFL